jgi:aminoglycoside phosphotransferase (APT) family kinase protein
MPENTGSDFPQVSQPPADGGMRLSWESIPAELRARVEAWLGSPVISAVSQPKGFSPGVASRLLTADDRRVFIKAASTIPNQGVPEIHRREARIVQALPPGLPVPRLLWVFDEGGDGWILMLFEDIPGRHPAQPWEKPELERVLTAMAGLSERLTPSPLAAGSVPTARDDFKANLTGWQVLKEEQPALAKRLDDWSSRHLDSLVQLERQAASVVEGNTLLHTDLRADNILLTAEKVWFVDWPHATVGAAWVDVIFFAPSVTMQGGPPPGQVIASQPAVQNANPAAVTAVVAALAGFFTQRALQPPPPGLPTLRPFQDAQGQVTRRWLSDRTGWK